MRSRSDGRALPVCLLLVCGVLRLCAADMDSAIKAYLDLDYATTLKDLDAVDQAHGRSPRAESVRAQALHALGRTRDAYISALAYAKLTAGRDLAQNEAHRAMLALTADLRRLLEAEREARLAAMQAERSKAAETADQAIAAIASEAARRTAASAAAQDRIIAESPSTIDAEELARINAATAGGLADRLMAKRAAIAELDTGPFKLGMTCRQIEAILHDRLWAERLRTEAANASSGYLQRFISGYSTEYRTEGEGCRVISFALRVDASSHRTFGSLSSVDHFAWIRDPRRQHEVMLQYHRSVERELSPQSEPALMPLLPGPAFFKVTRLEFDEAQRVFAIEATAVFFPPFRDKAKVLRRFTDRFGPPTRGFALTSASRGTGVFGSGDVIEYAGDGPVSLVVSVHGADGDGEPGWHDPMHLRLRLERRREIAFTGLALKELNHPQGKPVVVVDRITGDPASAAGMRVGDVLSSVESVAIVSAAQALTLLRTSKPGSPLALGIIRDGMPQAVRLVPGTAAPEPSPAEKLPATLGITVSGTDQGVLVQEATSQFARTAGLRVGDIIISVAGRPIATDRDLIDALRGLRPGQWIYLGLLRKGRPLTVMGMVEAGAGP